jgi:hypothetical protein
MSSLTSVSLSSPLIGSAADHANRHKCRGCLACNLALKERTMNRGMRPFSLSLYEGRTLLNSRTERQLTKHILKCRLHLQGQRISRARSRHEQVVTCFLQLSCLASWILNLETTFSPKRRLTLSGLHCKSRASSVGIATGYVDGRGSVPSGGERFFSTSQRSDPLWDPLSLITNGYRALSSSEGGRIMKLTTPPLSTAEVKNCGDTVYTSTPPYVFMAWCLIN